MPWCPKCKAEYEKEYKVCSVCGSALVDQLNMKTCDHEAYLMTASGQVEANVIEAFLASNHIPVLRKYRGNGDYLNIYMGNSLTGVDLFVPSRSIEVAKQLISNGFNGETENLDSQDTELTNEQQTILKKRSKRAWLYLLFFFVPMLFALIAGAFTIIRLI